MNMSRLRIDRTSWSLLVLICVSNIMGCAAMRHGWTSPDYEGRLLSAASGPGAERVQIEADFDFRVRDYLAQHGNPDYIFVVNTSTVHFFYLEEDRQVSFKRSLDGNKLVLTNGIPAEFRERM